MEGEPAIEFVDSEPDVAVAVVTIDFVVKNQNRAIIGTCRDTLLIRDIGANPKVAEIKTQILSREDKFIGR